MDFRLRALTLKDASSIANYANNAAIADKLTDKFPNPYRLADAERWIQLITAPANQSIIRGIEIDGAICGGIGLHPQDDVWRKNAELGYWLGEPFWGRGVVTQAINQMVVLGFEDLPVDRIFARPFGSNRASQRVLEKAGFVLEARLTNTIYKNGRYEDELVYARRR
jgi:ribosomal-protein-alanine N-acetyltransferase